MFNIIVTGNLLNQQTAEQVIPALAKLFKLSTEKATGVLEKAPMAVKKKVPMEVAEKYQAALQSIGLETAIEAVVNTKVPVTETESASSEPSEPEAEPASTPASKQPFSEPKDVNQSTPEHFQGLEFKLDGQPDYGFATVQIPAGETLKVEASAMATMDTNILMKTKAKGGIGRMFTGESLFINEFTAENGQGEIGIAPGAPGDIKHVYLDNQTIYLQNSAFVASTMGVATETKWQGLTKGFFSGESLFLIRCSGQGDLWFNTYGAIIEIDVEQNYVVDTGNIVAFTDGLDYNITKVGGYKSLFFSGEGFVCRFSGKGKVWIQTRSVPAFASWAHWYRPSKN